MSNFNLISPEGNGFNFNVRFDEPIIVPENASVHMNWCQFERDNLINFTEAQFIKIKNQQVLPFYNWDNNGNGKVDGSYLLNGIERNVGDFTFTIPQGKYSLADLQTEIVKAFTSDDKTIAVNVSEERQGINANTIAPDNASLKLYEYDLVCPVFEPDPTYLETGFMLLTKPRNFLADTVNNLGMTYDTSASFPLQGGLTRKENPTTDGTFTNGLPDITAYNVYSMGKNKYIHTGGHFQQYINNPNLKGNIIKNGGFDELQNLNTINFRSNTKFSDTEGSTFVGLYISGYAGATDGSVIGDLTDDPLANRIHGTNMIAKRDSVSNSGGYYPKCHFGVEYTGFDTSVFTNGEEDKLNIIHAQLSGTTMESTIQGMKKVYEIDLKQYRDIGSDDSELAFGIQTYYDKGNSNSAYSGASKGDLHIRVFLQMIDGSSVVVYDTNTKYPHVDITNGDHQQFFPKAFMDTYNDPTEASTITLAQAQSSIPFVPIVSATKRLEGGYLSYSQIDEFSRTETNSLLLDYQLEFSNQIGNLIQPLGNNSTYTSGILSPAYISKNGADNFIKNEITNLFTATLGQNEFYFRENNVLGQYRQDKFSVVLNNLPIKSYKNTNDKTKSGYRKPILANIPNPFSGADMSMGNGGKIMGSYQSSLGIVNRLSNQAITTNNFDVLILDLETDKPAEQLTKTIVNFTITAD